MTTRGPAWESTYARLSPTAWVIDGNPDRASACDGEHQGERVLAVAQHERDAIARVDARWR